MAASNVTPFPGGGPPVITGVARHVRVESHPQISLYFVDLSSEVRNWPGVFGSRSDLQIFLNGVQAGATLAGRRFILQGEIPLEPTEYAELKIRLD